tara:strand:+ start:1486 stop:1611 length:126 start_codon:yes stop_codon:yes gene_type:complete
VGQGHEYFLNNRMKFSDFVGFRGDANVGAMSVSSGIQGNKK